MRRKDTDWEKTFAKDISYEGLLSRIQKELFKLNNNGKKIWTAYQRRYSDGKQHVKDALHCTSLEDCKLRQQCNATHLLECPKSQALTTPNAGEGVEQQELPFIAGGNAKWYDHFGRQFGSLVKNKTYFLPYDPAIMLFDIYPKELKIYVHIKTGTQRFYS